MIDTGAYGDRMARYLHLNAPPPHATLGSGRARLAVTRLNAPAGFGEPTENIPVEKAFSIHLHLRSTHGGRLWLGGKLVPTGKRPSGGVTILDLEEEPIAFFPNPIDVVQFYIPRTALDDFACEHSIAPVDTLRWPYCGMDTTLKHLGMTILSAIQQPGVPPTLFLDCVGQAVLAYALHMYAGSHSQPRPFRGQLSPSQARRAKEYLLANLHRDISLVSVATQCGLSVSHFAHSFRRSFGIPPHRWLTHQRIQAVKALLLNSRLSLAEIAMECGFADQPALNRSFRRVVGQSPGAWRRSRKGHL